MGKFSKIEWTHHTFNPWWGCTKVSEACAHCYAETWSKRVGQELWGPRGSRRFFGEKHWNQPLKWDEEAQLTGVRPRVFCASMADVFEKRKVLETPRKKLFKLIDETKHLDWLILTKRPENIRTLSPWATQAPDNVWLGATVENQARADERIPHLAQVNSKVRFVSCEPLLGPLSLAKWLKQEISWVIAGGESGGLSRPSHPTWFKALRDECIEAEVPFHFKQWGNWSPTNDTLSNGHKILNLDDGERMIRFGKARSGRQLDGRTWDQIPTPA